LSDTREAFEQWAKHEGKGGLNRIACWPAFLAGRDAALAEAAGRINETIFNLPVSDHALIRGIVALVESLKSGTAGPLPAEK
jgi:hypothetical protein